MCERRTDVESSFFRVTIIHVESQRDEQEQKCEKEER